MRSTHMGRLAFGGASPGRGLISPAGGACYGGNYAQLISGQRTTDGIQRRGPHGADTTHQPGDPGRGSSTESSRRTSAGRNGSRNRNRSRARSRASTTATLEDALVTGWNLEVLREQTAHTRHRAPAPIDLVARLSEPAFGGSPTNPGV